MVRNREQNNRPAFGDVKGSGESGEVQENQVHADCQSFRQAADGFYGLWTKYKELGRDGQDTVVANAKRYHVYDYLLQRWESEHAEEEAPDFTLREEIPGPAEVSEEEILVVTSRLREAVNTLYADWSEFQHLADPDQWRLKAIIREHGLQRHFEERWEAEHPDQRINFPDTEKAVSEGYASPSEAPTEAIKR